MNENHDELGRFATSNGVHVAVRGNDLTIHSDFGRINATIDPKRKIIDSPASSVDAEHRGKGYGVALYQALADYAQEHGLTIRSANPITVEAARMYEALARRGYDVVKHPKARAEGAATIGRDNVVVVHGERIGSDAVYTIRPRKKSAPGAHTLYR